MARPSKLTPKTIDTLCEKLALGMTYTGACGAARIDVETFGRWRKAGQEAKRRLDENHELVLTPDEKRYVDFVERIAEAEAQIEEDYTTMIYNDAGRDVASAWKWLSLRRQDYKAQSTVIVDWRKEAENAGIDADAAYQRAVAAIVAHITEGARPDDGRGAAGSATTGETGE